MAGQHAKRRLAAHIDDKAVLNRIGQYLLRTAERGGSIFDYDRGISLGCPLSPLIGAFFLHDLDQRMERSGMFYVRFMDDILVLAPTRWKLRRAVRAVNEVLGSLGLDMHPDKTFVGRIEKGFDFLGYHFSRTGLTVAKAIIEKFVERAARLYEQCRMEPIAPPGWDRTSVGWAYGGIYPPDRPEPVKLS